MMVLQTWKDWRMSTTSKHQKSEAIEKGVSGVVKLMINSIQDIHLIYTPPNKKERSNS